MAATETPQPPPPEPPANVEVVETSLGKIDVGVIEPVKAPTAVALLVHGKSPNVIWEWREVAERLSERGVAAVLPNLHSTSATNPAQAEVESVQVGLREILVWTCSRFVNTPVVVYGKSWGGAHAAALAAAEADTVTGLVLACPSHRVLSDLASTLAEVRQPTLLLWARDDTVVAFENHAAFLTPLKERPGGDKKTIFATSETGNHNVGPLLENPSTGDKMLNWPDLAGLLNSVAP
eukprot:TRINITY_DN65151_c0_g1_i1.p1 TRINITY_DN65151_c0_g1~~TRINITY_DN65151_c0_g1_i1.p1  ORF type:complete len:236 (+),score=38.24 TRINITY_DN65151_c0_g1_i1:124-831(+)